MNKTNFIHAYDALPDWVLDGPATRVYVIDALFHFINLHLRGFGYTPRQLFHFICEVSAIGREFDQALASDENSHAFNRIHAAGKFTLAIYGIGRLTESKDEFSSCNWSVRFVLNLERQVAGEADESFHSSPLPWRLKRREAFRPAIKLGRYVLRPAVFMAAHHSGPKRVGFGGRGCGFCGAGWCQMREVWRSFSADQLGPDQVPIVGAKLFQVGIRINFAPFARKGWACYPQPFCDLIEVLLVYFELLSDFTPSIRAINWECHADYSSHTLAVVKPLARYIFEPSA